MKKMMILLLTGALMAACGHRTADAANAILSETADSAVITIDSIGVSMTLKVDLPTADDSALNRTLAQQVAQLLFTDTEGNALADAPEYAGHLRQYIADLAVREWTLLEHDTYDAFPEQVGEDEDGISRAEMRQMAAEGDAALSSAEVTVRKVYDTDSLVSWQYDSYVFIQNAAHPSLRGGGFTIRKSYGSMVGANLLKNTDAPQFRQLLKEAFRRWIQTEMEDKADTDAQLKDYLAQESQDVNALPLPRQPLFLHANGVALPYAEGELSVASGTTVLILPYEQVKPFMK